MKIFPLLLVTFSSVFIICLSSHAQNSCRCVQYNTGRGICYYFRNRIAKTCGARKCEPTYVCDSKGVKLCRYKEFTKRIKPTGNNKCVEKSIKFTKLMPYASLVPTGKPLVFRTARSQSTDDGGDPFKVLKSQQITTWPGTCILTKEGKGPWWLGYLRDISWVSSITLTFRTDNDFYALKPQLRVYVDGYQCTLERQATYDYPKVKYHCGGAIGYRVIVYIPGQNRTLSFCGITATGFPQKRSLLSFISKSATASTDYYYANTINNPLNLPHEQRWVGTCYHSRRGDYSWWTARLAGRSIVQQVIVYARNDTFSTNKYRYTNLTVLAGRKSCVHEKTDEIEATLYYKCQDIPASSITVQSALKNEFLHFCGLDVYGFSGPKHNFLVPNPVKGRPKTFTIDIFAEAACWIFYNGEHIGDCHNPGFKHRFIGQIPRMGRCPIITIKAMGGTKFGYLVGKVSTDHKWDASGVSWKVATSVDNGWMNTTYPAKEFNAPSVVKIDEKEVNSTMIDFMKTTGAKPVWASPYKKGAKVYFRVPVSGCIDQ